MPAFPRHLFATHTPKSNKQHRKNAITTTTTTKEISFQTTKNPPIRNLKTSKKPKENNQNLTQIFQTPLTREFRFGKLNGLLIKEYPKVIF
jgi:hypothetical protein